MYSQEQKCICQEDLEKLTRVLITSRHIVIVPHANADPDALSSSCALAYIVGTLNKNAEVSIIAPEGIGLECRRLLDLCHSVNTKIVIAKKSVDVEDIFNKKPVCFLVDIASAEQTKILKNYLTLCSSIIIMDHHEAHEYTLLLRAVENNVLIVCSEASSTSEIVFELSKQLGITPPKEILEMLIAGMLWDTKRFLRATSSTFEHAAEILKLGADYQRSQQLILAPRPPHTKIAKIKCVLRHKGYKVTLDDDEVYIALSEVGAYESECATSLIGIGYDIAFVASEEESINAIRVVYRVRENLELLQKIDVYNDIIRQLIQRFGGGGGGHKAAGGAIINASSTDVVLKEIIKTLISIAKGKIVELAESRVLEG